MQQRTRTLHVDQQPDIPLLLLPPPLRDFVCVRTSTPFGHTCDPARPLMVTLYGIYSQEDDDEFLEHTVAIGHMDQLRAMHGKIKKVEQETNASRADNQKKLKEMYGDSPR
jgi:hypothetical protein